MRVAKRQTQVVGVAVLLIVLAVIGFVLYIQSTSKTNTSTAPVSTSSQTNDATSDIKRPADVDAAATPLESSELDSMDDQLDTSMDF